MLDVGINLLIEMKTRLYGRFVVEDNEDALLRDLTKSNLLDIYILCKHTGADPAEFIDYDLSILESVLDTLAQ